MKNSKLILYGLVHALGIAVYVFGIALLIQNGGKIFGQMNNLFGPVAFLLLFVLSAAITGALALGKPVILYLNKQKREAIKLFLYTVGWIFVMTLIVLIIQLFIS